MTHTTLPIDPAGSEAISPSTLLRMYCRVAIASGMMLFFFIAGPAIADERPDSFATLAEKLSPAVVNISTTMVIGQQAEDLPQFPPGSPFEDFFKEFRDRDSGQQVQALGSGFIISADGMVVTNNHVIEKADKIRVTLSNDRAYDAKLIGRDPKTDVAVLKFDPEGEALTPVQFGNSDKMRVGDWVVAIGNPFGLGGSVTAGIISARGRDIGSGPYDDFIQTDASINRGNSGGPLFNLDGEVIGINTAIYSQTGGSVGIGFAIAANLASNVVAQLQEHGQTRRGWLGVFIQEITPEIAESFGLENENGALISSVHPDGPAEKSGLKAGDVVLSFNNKPITQMRNLPRIVAESEISKPLVMVVIRDGRKVELEVTLGVLEEAEQSGILALADSDAPGEAFTLEDLGLTVEQIGDDLRDRYSLADDVEGIVITEISPNSFADESDLLEGDVIRRVGKTREVMVLADLLEGINDEKDAGKANLVLLVQRQGRDRFVGLQIK